MCSLHVSLFGTVQVSYGPQADAPTMSRIPQLLLAYFMLQRGRAHSRSVLASLFWADHPEEHARNCLNTALWRLRVALEPDGSDRGKYLRTTPTGEIGFNDQSDYWLDVAILESCAAQTLRRPLAAWDPGDAARLDAALQLYRGDLLEGCYDDWALRERERLRDLYLTGLAHLMIYYRDGGEFEHSATYAQKILYHDPLREEVHRALMQLYAWTGRRALAVRQYEMCCELLARELNIPPMEETQRLAADLLSIPPSTQATVAAPARRECPQSPTLEEVVQQFHCALRRLEETQEDFRATARLLEQFLASSNTRSH